MSTPDGAAAALAALQDRTLCSRTLKLVTLLDVWRHRHTAEDAHRTRKAAWDALGEIQQLQAFLGMLAVDVTAELDYYLATGPAGDNSVQDPPRPE